MRTAKQEINALPSYRWNLKDTVFPKNKGTVFSCFACGGGSTMGYKLAGFDVLGCNEIDPRMARAYTANHKPRYCFLEPIQEFKKRREFPPELYDLDILDGSPPCSSFSMAGYREEKWGVKKKFREGQEEQVLDTLFFDFIDLARKLQPRVVIAENVKGMLMGNAREYVDRVVAELDEAGYYCSYQLLNSSHMGVPQRRERVFFIAVRKDLAFPRQGWTRDPRVVVRVDGKPIPFGKVYHPGVDDTPMKKTGKMYQYWRARKPGDTGFEQLTARVNGKPSGYNNTLLTQDRIAPTFVSNGTCVLFDEFRAPNQVESCCIGSFPQDYNFAGNPFKYMIGMSVPPLMTYGVAMAVAQQILELNREVPRNNLRPAVPPRLLRNRWLQAGKWTYDTENW